MVVLFLGSFLPLQPHPDIDSSSSSSSSRNVVRDDQSSRAQVPRMHVGHFNSPDSLAMLISWHNHFRAGARPWIESLSACLISYPSDMVNRHTAAYHLNHLVCHPHCVPTRTELLILATSQTSRCSPWWTGLVTSQTIQTRIQVLSSKISRHLVSGLTGASLFWASWLAERQISVHLRCLIRAAPSPVEHRKWLGAQVMLWGFGARHCRCVSLLWLSLCCFSCKPSPSTALYSRPAVWDQVVDVTCFAAPRRGPECLYWRPTR